MDRESFFSPACLRRPRSADEAKRRFLYLIEATEGPRESIRKGSSPLQLQHKITACRSGEIYRNIEERVLGLRKEPQILKFNREEKAKELC